MVALIRTGDWETPLFFHVAGAMLLVGGMFVVSASLLLAWRSQDEGTSVALTRVAYRTLFFLVLPAYIVMRIGAQWVLSKSPFDAIADDLTWVTIGYLIADIGGILLLVALILAGVGLRRAADKGPGRTSARIVTVVTLLLLAAYIVAIWAMTTKPS
jgi:uncharacterized membrane protein